MNYRSIILTIGLFLALSALVSAAPGDLDPTFSGDGKLTDWAGYAHGVAIQPDGKIVMVGLAAANDNSFSVARYNTEGSPDVTFGVNGRVTTTFGSDDAESMAVAVQSDGKIVAAGYVCPCGDYGAAAFAIARYNPDGTLDLSFDGDGKVITSIGNGDDSLATLVIDGSGRIVAAGNSYNGSQADFAAVRYNADGSLDSSFNGDGKVTTAIGTTSDASAGLMIVRPSTADNTEIAGVIIASP